MESTRILIVDDNMLNRELLIDMLQTDNVEITQASDGEEAIRLLEPPAEPFDIMLLDLVMPKMDGFEALEAIRKDNLAQDMPIVMISAENVADFMSRAYDLGACDYIPRPFDANVVQRRVHNILELYKKQRAIAAQLAEANMRYMDTIKSTRADIVLYMHINLERNTFVQSAQTQPYLGGLKHEAGIDDLVNALFEHVPDAEQRAQIIKTMSRANIMRCWQAGQSTIAFEHDFIDLNGRRIKLATSLGIVENPVDGELEAMLCSLDISRAYIKRRMETLLYEDVYEYVAIIDVSKNTINTCSVTGDAAKRGSLATYHNMDFCLAAKQCAEHFVLEQDRPFFLENTKLDRICKTLAADGEHTFVVRTPRTDGKKIRYDFCYLDDACDIIVACARDCTKDTETDLLTGRLNRTGFENAVDARLKIDAGSACELSILHIDIRGFKNVNELFGRETGNAILRDFAKVLSHSALEPLAIGRIEADKFLCLVKNEHINDATLRDTLSFTAKAMDKKTVNLHARCGIYPIKNVEHPASSMCDAAAVALAAITNEFAKPYAFFNTQVHESYLKRELMLSSIETAIENNEFKPYYQPIVDAKTHEIVSAEALVRWESPKMGTVSPGDFIPALERSGRVSLVDLKIAQSVQKMLEARDAQGKRIVAVSTNLSRMDFYDEDMMNELVSNIKKATIDARYLRKELTESSYVAFSNRQRELLDRLIELGAPLLLDDFGTGASSFSTVRDVDFSIIKIDKSFVDGIGASEKGDSLLYSIVRMAHSLGLGVVAEGVETKEQVDFLAACDCDYIQGYYFSKPLPQDEFEALLDMESIDWQALKA